MGLNSLDAVRAQKIRKTLCVHRNIMYFGSMEAQDTIDFQLRWGWSKLARLYTSLAESHGISMSVGYALLSIEREGTPSTKLGPRMGMEATSLSRTLKGMEDKGLIERRQDNVDRRSVRVFLTEDGVQARRQIRELVIELNTRLHELLGEEAADQLLMGLARLNELLEVPDQLIPPNWQPQTESLSS